MQFLKKFVAPATIALIALALSLGLAACGGEENKGQSSEGKTQQSNYNRLVEAQPAHTMTYSPTRATINFWIDTWGHDPNKLSYVYMQAANGQLTGYYVFKGLPVSYCASITPTYKLIDTPHDGSDQQNQQVPAPSIDAVYYSGGQCNDYYGRDATTNSYIEYTVGDSQNVLVYERPLPRQDVEPLGFTTIEEVK